MSTIRDPAVITTAGRQMMTAGGDIIYTKAVLFGQDISHLSQEQLVSLTSIGSPLLTVPVGISDKNDVGASTTVVLEATFQNANLKADLTYTAVGFFAKRGDDAEKLVIVGVANSDACLVAASPDGVATDALDIKVAIAIGDATDVTAVVDPAGSVTPATLNSAINKVTHDLTDQIATKADAKTVNDAIGKIDFTPYAKSEDVTALQGKVNQTISALQQTVQSLQNTVNQQATTITGLQTQVNNQAQDIAYIKANYIEGKRFSKANESQATAWEKENSQRIAFITDN